MGGEGKKTLRGHLLYESLQIVMFPHLCKFMVIETGAFEPAVIQLEGQGPDEMELHAGVGTEADDIPRVGGDFRFIEDNVEHAINKRGVWVDKVLWKFRVVILRQVRVSI